MKALSKAPLLLPLIILLNSCSISSPLAQTPPPSPSPSPAKLPPATPPKPAPSSIKTSPSPATITKHPLKVYTTSLNGTTFTAVTFDRRDHKLKVLDQKQGPGSQFTSASEAASTVKGSLAAINGGFFTPDGQPIGLVITNGEARGSFNSSSFLGTGILDAQNLTLSSRKNYTKSSELLQSGPRLLWPGQPLTGLSVKNSRPRSLLIWDGKNHFGIVHASSATLQGLSNNLKAQPLPDFHITHALNLDGGTSSDLWASSIIPGGGITKRSFFNKNVRNYLVLQKKKNTPVP